MKKVLLIKSIQSIRHPPCTDVKMNVPPQFTDTFSFKEWHLGEIYLLIFSKTALQ